MAALTQTLIALESAMLTTGEFQNVVIGEPTTAVQNGTIGIFMDNSDTGDLNLATANEFRFVIMRNHLRKFEDERAVELEHARVYDVIRSTIGGDVDLSTFGGAETGVIEVWQAEITGNWGNLQLDNTMFRVMDVRLPLWVCDVALAR